MASLVVVTTLTEAQNAGWSFLGSDNNWYGEKPVQCGGRLVACASTSAGLLLSMQQSEYNQYYFQSNSPETSTFPGHV